MAMIKWLHLSDLHLNKPGVESTRMRRKLLNFLQENEIKCDYIFITGDLRYAPEGRLDISATIFLNELCEAIQVDVGHVFIVPGNHDVDRDDELRQQGINHVCGDSTSKGYYKSREGVICGEDIEDLMAGMDNFFEVLGKFYKDVPERLELYRSFQHPHFCVETEDFNVVHLNSVLTYSKDRPKDLIVGTELLMEVLETINPNKTTILLTHYSFDFLEREEQKIILGLLEDYHVQLWFAGHEHDELLRRQRDYFYEFQCGNLLYEGEGTRSCVILGEYMPEERKGKVQVYEWDSPKDWILHLLISRQEDRSTYQFDLSDDRAKMAEVTTIISSPEYRKVAEDVYVFNLYNLNREMLDNLSESQFLEVKNQLGTRLNGLESRREIENLFLSEIHMSLNSKKRYECMPLFENVVRDRYKCYIYLDGNFAPFCEAEALHFYIDDSDCFQIFNDAFQMVVLTERKKIINFSFGYSLNHLCDVDERLLKFEMIKKYLLAEKVYVKMVGHEEYSLSFPGQLTPDGWDKVRAETDFWIEQMKRISKIENHYAIKFVLPEKASEEEYVAIDVLSDSIAGESCITLPPVPMTHPGFSRTFTLKEDTYIGNGVELLPLVLFNHTFRPVAQYMMAGTYRWRRNAKGWVSEQNKGGVPIRVEFELSFEEEKDRTLIEMVSFDAVTEEFQGREIVNLTGEDVDFLEHYIKVMHDVQEIWQLYLVYKEQVGKCITFDVIDSDGEGAEKRIGGIFDKISINQLTNAIVYSGGLLVSRMDNLINYMGLDYGQPIGMEWTLDNIGYAWMVAMRQYSMGGHFPISVGDGGEYFYDLTAIVYEVNQSDNHELAEIIAICRDEFAAYSYDLSRMEHYQMLRNYLYVIASRQVKYYEMIKEPLCQMYRKIMSLIDEYPGLLVEYGTYKDYVVYSLNDEKNLYAIRYTDDTILNYERFYQEANRHYMDCKKGMRYFSNQKDSGK